MAKKGFFSWFRKDKSKDEVEAPEVEVADNAAELATKEAEALVLKEALVLREAEALTEGEAAALAEREAAEQERLAAQAQAEIEAAEQARLAAEALAVKARQEAEALVLREAEALAEKEAAALAEREAVEQERLAAEALALKEAEALVLREAEALAEKEAAALAEREAVEQERLAAQAQAEIEAQARQEAEALALKEAEALAAQEAADLEDASVTQEAEKQPEPQAKPVKEGFFARLKRGLKRTSENIGSGFIGLFKGKKIDDDLFEELEEQLLIADVGVETTTRLIESLTEQASRKQLKDGEALYELLREEMQKTLEPVSIPLVPDNADGPFVILMVGVNGVGKTTTIGKLAKQYQAEGKSVMLAAGDTFRAAAVEQLQVWGQRNDIPVVAQHTGADSASVLFDALQAARARNIDVLIADTAGRLQNKAHLMDELKKIVRVMKKLDENAPHEVMLTLDAGTGQNAISQADLFKKAVGVTGITISKLDGTAKGGVIFAIADKFGIPIRHIGVGEQIDDLRTFDAKDFIDALFTQDNEEQK
ncbi:signal recognition particle-docking protein FtsY [Shewanella psychropiezotolerans]|uniref:Signal recognition particle receptor FtsY n=1 Tax=Shewanella psychropiezotolerans TaxID=2593655 RepID=A0ABX5WSN2_9GAMM|nr:MULTISPECIES: signal recognition particle-docking protein FtsY [Shewanella]MPY25438.1 signal recognition particle-docking protein FtsY [Shewanella sp. YLB-07]QDO82094.1 signal recognition particle-docking protein FtsY [Shewanella psychropiezotolerans]